MSWSNPDFQIDGYKVWRRDGEIDYMAHSPLGIELKRGKLEDMIEVVREVAAKRRAILAKG